jgi:hypothetical protein
MMHEDPIAGSKIPNRSPDFFDHPDRFMTEDQWRLALKVPWHDIA